MRTIELASHPMPHDVSQFFDVQAPTWHTHATDGHKPVISQIIGLAGIEGGMDVLDVACGTGILFPYYLDKSVRTVTGVDISSSMCTFARLNHADPRINIVNTDIMEYHGTRRFDAVMLFNALPHFEDTQALLAHLCSMCRSGGCITVAHDMGRSALNTLHANRANHVSRALEPASFLANLLSQFAIVRHSVDTQEMLVVTARVR